MSLFVRFALAGTLLICVAGCSAEQFGGEDENWEEAGMEPEGPDGPGIGKADNMSSWPAMATLPEGCPNAGFTPLFTPDDPTTTLELQQIDRVRNARKEDDGEYAEGSNPFRIRYAVYNLSHKTILNRLTTAESEGVDVQVLIEADQLHKEWNIVAQRFRDAGLEVVYDHHDLTEETRHTADLVGISEKGLMHLKTRLFSAPGEVTLLTGSLNPNNSAGANEENLHLSRNPGLLSAYAEAFNAQIEGRTMQNLWQEGEPVNVMFSPVKSGERAVDRLLQWVEEEDEQILLMVFSLRDLTGPGHADSLVDILARKHDEGIPVAVITDRKQSDGVDMYGNKVFWDDRTDDKLREAGIPVYEAINDASAYFNEPYAYAAMHHKSAILGKTRIRVITDASNWTKAALGSHNKTARNVESQLYIESADLDDNRTGLRYMGQWLKVLERYGRQSVEKDGEMQPVDLVQQLTSHEDWPTVTVRFTAVAETEMGEEIFALGDIPALGDWGESGEGVKLSTTAETYPTWESSDVQLPLGAPLEWKLVASSETGVRWEGGENRQSSPSLPLCGAAILHAEWR